MIIKFSNLKNTKFLSSTLWALGLFLISITSLARTNVTNPHYFGINALQIKAGQHLEIKLCQGLIRRALGCSALQQVIELIDDTTETASHVFADNEDKNGQLHFIPIAQNKYLEDVDHDGNLEFAVAYLRDKNTSIIDASIFTILKNDITCYDQGTFNWETGPYVRHITKFRGLPPLTAGEKEKLGQAESIAPATNKTKEEGKAYFLPVYSGLTKLVTKSGQYLEIRHCWKEDHPCYEYRCDIHLNQFALINGTKRTNYSHLIGDWAYAHHLYFVKIAQNTYLKDLDHDGNPEFAIGYDSGGNNPFVDAYIFSLKNNTIIPYGVGRFHFEWGPYVKNITPGHHPTPSPEYFYPNNLAAQKNISFTVECVR